MCVLKSGHVHDVGRDGVKKSDKINRDLSGIIIMTSVHELYNFVDVDN